nr:alpha/beta hydrolase [Nocardiopsis mwathae]
MGQSISWKPCHDDDEVDELHDADLEVGFDEDEAEEARDWRAALECGSLTVPVDYADPEGRSLKMRVIRKPAEGTADDRVGSLIVNPGGPGVSGVEHMDSPAFGDGIRSRFDIVSFDPRGVGKSRAIMCGDPEALYGAQDAIHGTDPAELSEAELGELEKAAKAYADACAEDVGEDFLGSVGTVDVVNDVEVLRDALGDDALTYVGFSYGTYIGALYAETYPDNVRALVLDGAVETTRSNADIAVDQAKGFQTAWESFVEDCIATGDYCPFSSTDAAENELERILGKIEDGGYEVAGMQATRSAMLNLISQMLYSEDNWEGLRYTLDAADYGDTQVAQDNLDAIAEDMFGGEEFTAGDDEDGTVDTEAALVAINCVDRTDPTDIEAYRKAAEKAAEASPLFGADVVWAQLPCAYWAADAPAPTEFSAEDAPPIVVVGTRNDPATPYAWAEELSEQLASATLVTYEGDGHTVYGYNKSACIDDPLDAYLIDTSVPEEGLSCPSAR